MSDFLPFLLPLLLPNRPALRFLIWDVAWDILDRISTPRLVDFLDRVWQLVGRLPEFTLSWSKSTIKRILTRIYRDFPHSFVNMEG